MIYAAQNHTWLLDIRGTLDPGALMQLLLLSYAVSLVYLNDLPDRLGWRWTHGSSLGAHGLPARCFSSLPSSIGTGLLTGF
jgi:hypothetical protein